MLDLFTDPTLRRVALGTACLGVVSGVLGSFAVLRRQSLIGDAVSHAALPGIALAFLFVGGTPLVLLLGAAISGWVATVVVGGVTRNSRIPFDSALAGTLAVFFGFGLMLMSYIQPLAGYSQSGLDRYLMGQAATMLVADVWVIAVIGGIAVAVLLLFWKEMKLASFDPDFAASLGYRIKLLELLLMALLVVAIVIGLQSVGVVLMSALIVAPAAAARQWTHRLGMMVVLAGVFGAVSGAAGSVLADRLTAPGHTVPTGPTIVLVATGLVLFSFLAHVRWRSAAAQSHPSNQ
jgi:manganese/zinc/iron transport system permease protein